jgi:hypothetical protein
MISRFPVPSSKFESSTLCIELTLDKRPRDGLSEESLYHLGETVLQLEDGDCNEVLPVWRRGKSGRDVLR